MEPRKTISPSQIHGTALLTEPKPAGKELPHIGLPLLAATERCIVGRTLQFAG